MTKEEIIRMAREAGLLPEKSNIAYQHPMYEFYIERFAALVAAHVRETEFKPDWNNYRQGVADGAADEREACAKVCEDNADDLSEGEWDSACINCAYHIRERGNS